MKQEYSKTLLDHVRNPRNAGSIEKPTAVVTIKNNVCGDVIRLYAALEGEKIREIRFRTYGCPPAIACASLVTEKLTGRPYREAATISARDLIDWVGGLPHSKLHAAEMAHEAVQKLYEELHKTVSAAAKCSHS